MIGSDKPILILEDDVEFDIDVKDKIESIDIPDDWALFYFGGNHNGHHPEMVSNNVHRLKKTFTTHCFAINPKYLNEIIDGFSETYTRYVIDEFLAYEIQTKYPCYGCFPHLAWQREGFSDILERETKYDFLK